MNLRRKEIVAELHKPARKNFIRRRVVLKGIDDLWQADLIDMQKIKKVNKGFKYILVVIDCFSKFAWGVPLKTKSKYDVANGFQKILNCDRIPINIQSDMGKEFYNEAFQKLLRLYKINHYSTYSVKKASIVERFIRTLKSKLYKYFTMVGNNKWIGSPLEDMLSSYNNTVHRSIKFKPIDVTSENQAIVMNNIKKSQTSQKSGKPKFKVGDSVRISKYKENFKKGYTPNWSSELFIIKKVNNTQPVTYAIEDQRNQLIFGSFYEQELQKTNHPYIYLIEKVIKKKGNKLFVKWLGLSERENCWINKMSIV